MYKVKVLLIVTIPHDVNFLSSSFDPSYEGVCQQQHALPPGVIGWSNSLRPTINTEYELIVLEK